MSDKKIFLNNLTGLRFLAASYVIAFHFFYFPGNEGLNNFISRGHIAVPFFFLLSGYVLSYSYSEYDFYNKTKRYILSRILRIAPIYYIGMFLAIPLFIRTNFIITNDSLSLTTIFSSLGLHLTFLQGVFPSKTIMYSWNVHSWSLCVEFFLYILSPLFLQRIGKISLRTCIILLFLLILINCGIYYSGISSSSYKVLNHDVVWHYQPFLYLPIFISGIILARIFALKRDLIESWSKVMFFVSSVVLILSFLYPMEKEFYSSFNPFYQVFFAILILSSSISNSLNSFLGSKYFILLGDASYAMYMFQAPVKFYTQQFLSKILHLSMNTGYVFAMLIYLNTVLLAIFVTKKIDPKIRRFMNKKLIR